MFSYLPAWRWAFPVFHSNFGVGDVISQMMLGIGGLLFDAADAAWFLLLWVVQLASSVDIAASAAKTIDKIVAAIANPIVNNSYLLGFVLVVITATMMWRVIRGYGSGRALKRALSSFVPLVILAVVFHASTLDNGTGNVVLSPAWIVKQVDSATNTLGSAVPTTLANVVPKTTSAAPSCETYEAGLTKSFVNSESKTNTSATDIPETVNDLWLQSYLFAWSAAQFGNADNGERIACRYLESTNNISSNTQAGIEALGEAQSGQTRVPTPAIGIFGPSNGVYNGDDLTASLTAWSACAYSGAWSVTAYGALDSGSGPTAKDCSVWWSGTQTASSSSFPNNGAAFCSGCNGQTSSQILAAGESGHSTATTFLTSYNGDDSGWSLVYGIFAGLASLAYLFALGALSLGTVLSQFMLIAVLCALPILLLMMSVGNRSGNAAAGMLKIGVGAVASKFCFLLVLGLLTELIDVINTFVGSSASPIMKVLGAGVAPLLAFYALHTLLRQVGMQGMMSFSGAIKMTAGIATGAHMRPPHDSAPRNRFEALDAKARGGLNNALNRGLTNSKPPMKEGGKSPDGNRNGGSRPPEVGTRKNASLYGGKKGAKTPALANETSNPKGALSLGAIRKGGKASQIINNVAGPLTPIQAAAKRSFSKFSAPEASAARKSARSKAFKVGLGAVGLLAPGVAGAAAIGVAKTATFVRAAKKRATTAKSAITQVQRQRANSRGIANQIGVITNRAKKQQRQVSINKRKDAATAVISGAGVKFH